MPKPDWSIVAWRAVGVLWYGACAFAILGSAYITFFV